ncbi:MAG: glycoside hydrolase family 3 C-terminal domain-containing protein, partial [Clostridiales bacterium]|nr:glycoside hydrolase family 3 C-terminal domain-containing protein [Clostridiales bacterium]
MIALSTMEKAALCSGLDAWRTKPAKDIPSVRMADGPNGLRFETEEDGTKSVARATCFPSACLLACSFDTELLEEMGAAMAKEARSKGVDLILGPSVNIKRNPLCGRNFEYFSEDPVLSGEMGAALVRGLQGGGVGATLKHFALNNQEKARLSSDSIADERAKREIYLKSFEIAISKSDPWAVMTAYNKIDGVYASENQELLGILKKEWGYGGLAMSDWGAVCDRIAGIEAGLDLEMPADSGFRARLISKAVDSGDLSITALDQAAKRVAKLGEKAEKARENPTSLIDIKAHHDLARRIAAESMVLLKNENGLLPLDPSQTFGVVGEFAKKPRYQGGGASNVHPTKLPNFLDELEASGISYELSDGEFRSETVIAFLGQPISYDSEGYDRPSMSLPESQVALLEKLSSMGKKVIALIFAGGAVETPWIGLVDCAIMCYLPGQGASGAALDVLFGKVNPSGKLAESFPKSYGDVLSKDFFGQEKVIEYRESVFVGYRHYQTAGIKVAFPFGHGLSYTSVEYSELLLEKREEGAFASFTLKNTGNVYGAEVCQLYVSPPASPVPRPVIELKAFKKIGLQPGEEATLSFDLKENDFSFWDPKERGWRTVGGFHKIIVGASSEDFRLQGQIWIEGDVCAAFAPFDFAGLSRESFEALLGRKVVEHQALPITRFSTLKEIRLTRVGRLIEKLVKKQSGNGEAA